MYGCGLCPNSKKMRLLFNELTLFARDCFGLRPRNDSGGCCHRERGSETFKEDFIFFSTRNPLWRVRVTERGDPVVWLRAAPEIASSLRLLAKTVAGVVIARIPSPFILL
jgi:hypothetical protein